MIAALVTVGVFAVLVLLWGLCRAAKIGDEVEPIDRERSER